MVDNCEAVALIADARHGEVGHVCGDVAPRARSAWPSAARSTDSSPTRRRWPPRTPPTLRTPSLGITMLYTSGTTGRPKGVNRPVAPRQAGAIGGHIRLLAGEDLHLCTGPLYHAAPLAFSHLIPLISGAGIVTHGALGPRGGTRLIERHRITHTHMVPTMFVQLLKLPQEVRDRYDVSSLRHVLHGAAPCPVHVKHALIEWLGPIVFEYYAATEGTGTMVDSATWLSRPGHGRQGVRRGPGQDRPTTTATNFPATRSARCT